LFGYNYRLGRYFYKIYYTAHSGIRYLINLALFRLYSTSYDAEGRHIKYVMPEAYNAESDDRSGYEYEYNAAEKMVKIINPEGEIEELYTYDMCGNTLPYTDGAGRSTYYSYNLQGKLIQVLRPAEEKEG